MLKDGQVVAIDNESQQVEADEIENQIAVDAVVTAREVAQEVEAGFNEPVQPIQEQPHPIFVSLYKTKQMHTTLCVFFCLLVRK